MLDILLATLLTLQSASPIPVVEHASVEVPPSPAEVLALPDELRVMFHKQVIRPNNSDEQRLRRIVDFMTSKDGMGVQYSPDSTHTVTETYRTRKVNCLSFTLLAVALAREAGLRAHGQRIDRIFSWNASGEVVMQNMHANAAIVVNNLNFIVDIATERLIAASNQYRISDDQLIALYYDNRAMEFLAAGRPADARLWLDTALRYAPADSALLNNAGVLSLRAGDPKTAEALFLKALERDPRLTSGLYNLIAFYRSRGDAVQAARWQVRADNQLRSDPFYQFAQGQQRESAGNFTEAIRFYKRAVSLNPVQQIFHFGLSRAYFQTGELQKARAELHAAANLADESDRMRYQAKMTALHQMEDR